MNSPLSPGLKPWICTGLMVSFIAVDISIIQVQPAVGQTQNVWQRIGNVFRPRSGVPSGRRRGGAVRDPDLCPPLAPGRSALTAVVPLQNEPIRTTDATPTFWFSVPYTINDDALNGDEHHHDALTNDALTNNALANDALANDALANDALANDAGKSDNSDSFAFEFEFVLQDEDFRDVYNKAFSFPTSAQFPGIVGLRPQLDSTTLAINQTYHWYFLIYCNDPDKIYEPAFVQGTVLREETAVDHTLRTQVESLRTQAEDDWRWLDILNILSLTYPDDPTTSAEWNDLLAAIDLEPDIREASFAGRFYIPTTPYQP